MTARTAVIWFPDWPVVAAARTAGHPPDAPIAVLDRGRVHACSQQARSEGVRRGQRTREAQARCPGLIVLNYDPVVDARVFEPVVVAIEEFAPGVEIIQPGTCAIGARGPAAYFDGEEAMVGRLREHLKYTVDGWLGSCHIGVADGPFTAEQAARIAWHKGNPGLLVAPGGSGEFLAELPVTVLERPDLAGLLHRLGIRTLGDFAALPARSVLARFGTDGALAHRLATGTEERPLAGRRPPPELAVSVRLEPAVDRIDTIAFAARGHAERLVSGLAGHGMVCTGLRVRVRSERGEEVSRCWRHPRWFTAADVVDRIRWQLRATSEQAVLSAGIELVELVPEEAAPIGEHPEGLWGDRAPDERVHRALTRVQSMLGHPAVVTAVEVGGRGYLDRTELVPWGDSKPAGERERRVTGTASVAAKIRVERPSWPGRLPSPSPATVFPNPYPAVVLDGTGCPVTVDIREMLSAPPASLETPGENPRAIARWAGPWVADERAWDPATASRVARFQVLCSDGTAWLLALTKDGWRVEACYD